MDRIPVESSNLVSIGHDAASGTLEVEFRGGRTYHYADVPRSIFDELMAAPSKGAFLYLKIQGRYSHTKV